MVRVAVVVAGGGDRVVTALAPLLFRWSPTVVLQPQMPPAEQVADLAETADAVLVIGPRARSPRTALAGPGVTAGERWVPTAWLPLVSLESIQQFALAAARVHDRAATPGRLGVLSQRQPRFERLADRIVRQAQHTGVQVERWTAYDMGREELVSRLHTGPALGLYVGHGRPIGWVGYAGMRAHHLEPGTDAEPAGAIVSLTCKTASRRRTGLSFAEAIPLTAVAAAAVGAVEPTHHTANARWAVRLAAALPAAATIGDLLGQVVPHDPHAASYRLLGDPTAPLRDAIQTAPLVGAIQTAPLVGADHTTRTQEVA